MSLLEAHQRTVDKQTTPARSDYWLEHSEGFQVFGPKGRIGSVALVLSSDEGVDGVVIRTGSLSTRSVFVPVDEIGSVVAREKRLELLIAPRVPRRRISEFVRELLAPAEPSSAYPVALVRLASDERGEMASGKPAIAGK